MPVLFSLFASTDVPCSVLPLFEELAQKSVAPFLNEDGTARTAHCLPPIMDGTSGNNFPCLPKRVQRGIYRQDKERQQDDCEKVSFSKKRHKTLTHGLFTLSCVHGKCPIHYIFLFLFLLYTLSSGNNVLVQDFESI